MFGAVGSAASSGFNFGSVSGGGVGTEGELAIFPL